MSPVAVAAIIRGPSRRHCPPDEEAPAHGLHVAALLERPPARAPGRARVLSPSSPFSNARFVSSLWSPLGLRAPRCSSLLLRLGLTPGRVSCGLLHKALMMMN